MLTSVLMGFKTLLSLLYEESGKMMGSGSGAGMVRLLLKSTDFKCLSLQIPHTARPMGKIWPFLV